MIRETFEQLINLGTQQIELIASPEAKVTACAELAKAIAMSGLLHEEESITVKQEETPKAPVKVEQKKTNTAKKELEKTAGKGKAEPNAEVKQEAVTTPPVSQETKKEPEIEAEWTAESLELFKDQLTYINQAVEAWGQEVVAIQAVGQFSEGLFTGMKNITPLNVCAFVAFLTKIASGQ